MESINLNCKCSPGKGLFYNAFINLIKNKQMSQKVEQRVWNYNLLHSFFPLTFLQMEESRPIIIPLSHN